jgi:tRNA(Ile)-lysidine synthetase-like protein
MSLSGGKDSMVQSFILAMLAKKYSINVCAVHINYCNRGNVNKQEVLFLQDWCQFLGIPLYWRNITEINREKCMKSGLRDTYESFTRNVRFDTYKQVWNQFATSKDTLPVVMMGHNKDDCFENIMTNIVQEKKYENLLGMEPESVMDGIKFIRALLKVTKSDIISFAKFHNIPYLYTSTPAWSHRGKIRNSVLPCMLKWDHRAESSMFALADKCSSLYRIIDNIVERNVKNTINTNTNMAECTICIDDLIMEDVFWFEYFKRVFEKLNVMEAMPSKKSLGSFLYRMRGFVETEKDFTKVILSKNALIEIIRVEKTKIKMIIKIDLKK